jgi:hypothetical protein
MLRESLRPWTLSNQDSGNYSDVLAYSNGNIYWSIANDIGGGCAVPTNLRCHFHHMIFFHSNLVFCLKKTQK